jgi:hypothetical protein
MVYLLTSGIASIDFNRFCRMFMLLKYLHHQKCTVMNNCETVVKEVMCNKFVPLSSQQLFVEYCNVVLPCELKCNCLFICCIKWCALYCFQLSYVGQDCWKIPPVLVQMYGTQVWFLDLSFNCLITLQGVEMFPHLEELVLDNNKLSDSVLVPDLPNLQILSLNKNNVSHVNN